jgi:hypothetical protein
MPRIRLPIVKEPKEGTATLMTRGEQIPAENTKPFFKGEGEGAGDTDLVCGQCSLLLAQTIPAGRIPSMVLRCPSCGAYNNVT